MRISFVRSAMLVVCAALAVDARAQSLEDNEHYSAFRRRAIHTQEPRPLPNMFKFTSTAEFIFDVLRKGGPMVAGVVALILGLVLYRIEPLIAGAVLLFFGLAEIVIRLLGIRTSG